MDLADRTAAITPSLSLSIDSRAKAMKAAGQDVCGFSAGEPDFDTPEHIKAATITALQEGFTKYTPSAGLPELREAITQKFANDNRISYKSSQIIVSNGAKQSCAEAILATCGPGGRGGHPGALLAVLPGDGPPGRRRARVRPHDGRANKLEDDCRGIPGCDDAAHQDGHPQFTRQSDRRRLYARKSCRASLRSASDEEILILSDEIYEEAYSMMMCRTRQSIAYMYEGA